MHRNLNLIKHLKQRCLISNITDEAFLLESIKNKNIALYCGFDPTADSLHIGHIVQLVCLKWFQLYGHKPIVIIGGATGLIGDPTFKLKKRKMLSFDEMIHSSNKIKQQVLNFFKLHGDVDILILNNYDWLSKINVISFFKEIGIHYTVNRLLKREIIKKNFSEKQISLTEFSYAILQALDFFELNKKYNVNLQIGGSDQWYNIISGINLIKKISKRKTIGLVTPIITNTNGVKFSKTDHHNTIWLDSKKTTPYQFYQFWLNVSDSNVYKFLKLFTFLDVDEISNMEKKYEKFNDKRLIISAKRLLAEQVTKLIHGEQCTKSVIGISKKIFSSCAELLEKLDFNQLMSSGLPVYKLDETDDLLNILVKTDLANSRTHARYMINKKAITINGKIQRNCEHVFCKKDKLFEKFALLCRGKKEYRLINW